MADYISREALLEKAWDVDTGCEYVQVVDVGDILEAPAADVVEVVRCKDCKYCHSYMSGNIYCTHSEGLTSQGPDAFCSYGKRRGT